MVVTGGELGKIVLTDTPPRDLVAPAGPGGR
jgi:hypothetical protein